MSDLERAERSIKMRGVASYQNVSVKIVPNGNGFGVETIVNGDRRYPIEEPMPLHEAQALALAQLLEPRAHYEFTPERTSSPKAQTVKHKYTPLGDILHSYKQRGLDHYKAWDQYIIDTILCKRFQTETRKAKTS